MFANSAVLSVIKADRSIWIQWMDGLEILYHCLQYFSLIRMDGWMTYDFTSFSTKFQSCQNDGQVIMEGCMQWNLVHG